MSLTEECDLPDPLILNDLLLLEIAAPPCAGPGADVHERGLILRQIGRLNPDVFDPWVEVWNDCSATQYSLITTE